MLTQALALGVDRGFSGGGAFLLATVFAFAALGIVLWKVLNRVASAPVPVAET